MIRVGPHAGKRALLIGETGDLRQRRQYVSGTQERGNKLWRETFLMLGDARLFILSLASFSVSGREPLGVSQVFYSNNLRLVLEQLLVMHALAEADDSTWVVNGRPQDLDGYIPRPLLFGMWESLQSPSMLVGLDQNDINTASRTS